MSYLGEDSSSEQMLGKQLQAARKRANITQQELCQRANLSYSTLAKIERGAIKSPSIFTIQSIAGALGVTLNDLLGTANSRASGPAKIKSASGVRFVYFDINGCLVRFFHRAFSRLSEDTGEPADAVESTFWHYNDAVCRGDMTMAEFNQALSTKLGKPNIDWSDYYLDAVDPITEMQDMLTWASERYYVGLLSNIMPGLIDTMRQRGMLPSTHFDQIIDSSQVHTIKPERDIYEIAQSRSGVKPEEILLVDDSRANLMAAEHLGWHVLWFDDYRIDESLDRIRQALKSAA
jgi:putative hydrolase of the HAD superfamily